MQGILFYGCLLALAMEVLPPPEVGQPLVSDIVANDAELLKAPATNSGAPTHPDWWKKTPRPQALPKPGFFPNPPVSGNGFYTGIDWLRGINREKAPVGAFPAIGPQFQPIFEVDFRKLDPPGDDRSFPGLDKLKRQQLGEDWLLATGGEVRYRAMSEGNARLRPINNDYDLFRARIFTDMWYSDTFRIYAEFISAEIWNNDLPPILPDKDPADFLNLFAEMKLLDLQGDAVALRFGRQELLFGSQRLISTLDWANTRRTFQGGQTDASYP